jgi:hypothetical protein
MHALGLPELMGLVVVGALLFDRRLQEKVARSLTTLFRGGGPGSPSHPIPSNDSAFLLRKRREKDRD